ncbi:MAG: ABC transporter ATP-binding protein, partial [Chloroflexi bacterium]|nr:ABC transporter ATP-binding protein [Chloroflexota bacterium]
MNKPAIQTFNLSKKFDNREAVHDLTIEVEQGEIIGFLGPNGAGKTTTIRMLTGIIAPTSGYAIVSGFKTGEDTDRIHEVTGLLTESPGFYNRLSALRNLEFFAGFYPDIDGKVQVEKYLKIMRLWERRNDRVGSYSKGMKHR